jgi:hypothetical protein
MPTEPELQTAAQNAGWAVQCISAEGSSWLYEFTPTG